MLGGIYSSDVGLTTALPRGGFRGSLGGLVDPPLTQDFIFMENFMHLEYLIYSKYSPLALYLIILFNKSVLLPVSVNTIAEWMENSVDPDDVLWRLIWVHSLHWSVCPNTCTYSKYGNPFQKSSWIRPCS